jgi:hypothetical protein
MLLARFPARESGARATAAQATEEVCDPCHGSWAQPERKGSVQTAQSAILIGHDFILSDLAPGVETILSFIIRLEAWVRTEPRH